MKKAKRWRYYCDFCKKTGGSKFHMEKHEKVCTANPDRKCGFCEIMGNGQPDIKDLKKVIEDGIIAKTEKVFDGLEYTWNILLKTATEETILEELREKANNCPACILSAIRQTKTVFIFDSFDFKKEKKSMYNDCKKNYDDDY